MFPTPTLLLVVLESQLKEGSDGPFFRGSGQSGGDEGGPEVDRVREADARVSRRGVSELSGEESEAQRVMRR